MKLRAYHLVWPAMFVGVLLIHSVIWLYRRDCPKPETYRAAALHGRVVGKDLWIVQYKWLRRRFSGTQASLTLYRIQPPPAQENEFVHRIYADNYGYFDFGAVPPGDYELFVQLAGSSHEAQRFVFSIDPAASAAPLLIDDSYQGRASCRGHDVDFK